jgi:Rrf2 family protein
MLSNKAKYALKALLALAGRYGEGPVLIAQLADSEAIPRRFLEQILLQLKQQGILHSKKGRGGGYVLARDPARIAVGQVVRLIDGPLAPVPCASQTAYRKCAECVDEETCGVRMVMRNVRDATAEILDGTSLADVRRQMDAALRPARRKSRRRGP